MPRGVYKHKPNQLFQKGHKHLEETKIKLKKNHSDKSAWSRGLTKESDIRVMKISKSNKGKKKPPFTKEHKRKLGLSHKGKPLSKRHRKKISESNKGHEVTKETRGKISKKNSGKKRTPETLDKMRKITTERMKNPEVRKNVSIKLKGKRNSPKTEFTSERVKKMWADPSYKEKTIKIILKSLMKRPTSYEKKISELCIENSLPFIYTGDGRFLINFKNPDFVNHKDKIVIEVFYSWFKVRDYGSVENYKEFCRQKYNSAGWRVIFIDENEVDIENWKELCLNKIKYDKQI